MRLSRVVSSPVSLRLACAAVFSLMLAACGGGATEAPGGGFQMPPTEVNTAQVISREVEQWDEFNGRFEAIERVVLRPRVSGYIDQVHFVEGADVAKDDLLFTIDARSFKAQVERGRAELARAQAQLAQAENDAARARTLIENKAISGEEFDARSSGVAQARAAVQAARAALEQSQLELSWTQVRAPIAGRTSVAAVTAGNTVLAGQTELTTLVSLDPIYVTFEGDEQTYLRYGDLARSGERDSSRDAGNPVRVGLANEPGYPHQGHMVMVDNALNPGTGTIRARARLDNPEGRFTPGLFARVQLLGTGMRPALLIHDQAVLTDQDRKYVYVAATVPEQGTVALRKDVQLGGSVDGLRIVTSGLDAGDRVIVNGMRKIFFPGAPVAPVDVPMDAPNTIVQPQDAAAAAPAQG